MVAELPEPRSKVMVELEDTLSGEPRAWVKVKRPGAAVAEELRYCDLMATPSNIEEDRVIKCEASRQYRILLREWRAKDIKPVPSFEIVRVVADRSPLDDDFRESRDLIIYYMLEGRERKDTPSSLDKMIRFSPDKFPPDAAAIIRTAVKEKMASLPAESRHQDTAAIEQMADGMPILDSTPEDIPKATLEASVTERPHPDSIEGAKARLELTKRFKEEQRATVAPKHAIKLHELRKDAAGELLIIAEIDGERKGWRYDDLEAELVDHAVEYPPLVLEMLLDKKKNFQTPRDSKFKEHGKNGSTVAADFIMAEVAKQGIEVFTDQFRMPFAAIERDGHREVHPISMDSDLGLWLTYLYYKATGGRAPPREALDQVVRTLTARARFEGEIHELSLRVAWHNGDLYYDPGREDWKAVRISPSIEPHGWEIVDRPPIIFKRNAQMLPQVIPEAGGDWSELWDVVNLPLDDYGALCRSHIVQMFIPGHPRPFLDLYNRRGGGKTFTAITLRSLVDPTTTPLAELRDLDRNFNNIMDQNYMPVFDNLKTITDNLEGKFCRCVTGETAQERRLGTNRQQEVYQYQRTGILTSVYQLGLDKPEVAARIIYLMVPFIENPTKESDLNAIFFSARPRILGFIFSTIAKAIEMLPEVKIDQLPRMADYATWGEAISRALGEDEEVFVKQYEENISQTISETLDANPLGQAILEYFESGKKEYVGTADPFYQELVLKAAERNIDIKSKEAANNWPGAPNALTRKMPNIVDDLKRFKLHYAKTTFGDLSDKAKGKMTETKLAPSRSVIMLVKEDSEIFSELPTERCKAEASGYAKNIVGGKPVSIKKGPKNDKTVFSACRRTEGG